MAIAPAALTQTPSAPDIVQVPHIWWYLPNRYDYIAGPLKAGQVVEFECKVTWCELASHNEARIVVAALKQDYGLCVRFDLIYRSERQRWFIIFSLE